MSDHFDELVGMLESRIVRQESELARSRKQLEAARKAATFEDQKELPLPAPAPKGRG